MSDNTADEPTPFADDKDWTWVLADVCPECGHDVRAFPREQIGAMIRANAAEWVQILGDSTDDLRRRPRDDKWSPLEYGFHVRDVYELYDFRLGLMLDEDGPHYPNWDQDETAVQKNYGAADPATVSAELDAEAEKLAVRFDGVSGDMWDRTGYRSDGAAFTVETFARYLIHDPVHHLGDVRTP
jgi:hypothetical protein